MEEDEVLNLDKEKKLIQGAYRNLLRSIQSLMSKEDRVNIRLAYEMAVRAHSEQRRKSGEPYILHPIEVARICVEEIGLGPTAVICALLHDVVEDTEVSLNDIRSHFGERIAMIVDGLTKLDSAFNAESPQAENFRKVLSTLKDDVRVVLIKMADRLHNLRTIGSMPYHKQIKIAAETTYIYAPLAHRLGLYNIKTEFQDLCMKITHPTEYQDIKFKLNETKQDRSQYINEFIKPLKDALEKVNCKYRITGRPKSIHSIWNKIKNKQVTFEEIYDLFAIRIILNPDLNAMSEKTACWMVYSIVTDVYRPISERLKDWITVPKSNGYESLHTTVIGPLGRFVEVQIRTERMDEIAERGYAAHWKYKGVSNSQQNVYETWLDNVREVLDNNNNNAVEFLQDFKTNLFHDEVVIYTPKGDAKMLPKGATALDFAYSIHSDIGSRCSAVKVNNKLEPLGYKLRTGDQIEIITNKNQKPSESWLKLVVTSKAISRIRSALKDEQKNQAEFGRESLERKLRNMKVDFESGVDVLVKHFEFKNRLDFFYAISIGQINLIEDLKQFKVENARLITEVIPKENNIQQVENPRKPLTHKPKLLVNGQSADMYEYTMATCCNPVMGDDVFAYLSGNGMKIHRTTCPNATNLLVNYGYRIMKAEWGTSVKSSFVADLLITGIDGPGVIQRLTDKISNSLSLNMRSITFSGEDGYFEGRISLVVMNTDQLNLAIRSLKAMDGITSVTRA